MSTGSAFVGLHPKQAFIVDGSATLAQAVATARGWRPKFGNALTWMNGSEPVRYVDDAEKLRGIDKGRRLYFGPAWQQRADAPLLEELVAEGRFEQEMA